MLFRSHRARAASVRALLVTSTGDDAALQAQHAQYLRTAQAAGARCASLSVADVGHMGLVIEFGRTRDRVTGALTRFFAARCVDAALSEGADVVALLAAVMKPKRPRLEAARDATRETNTGVTAWAALHAGALLPATWASAERRCFSRFATGRQ